MSLHPVKSYLSKKIPYAFINQGYSQLNHLIPYELCFVGLAADCVLNMAICFGLAVKLAVSQSYRWATSLVLCSNKPFDPDSIL